MHVETLKQIEIALQVNRDFEQNGRRNRMEKHLRVFLVLIHVLFFSDPKSFSC